MKNGYVLRMLLLYYLKTVLSKDNKEDRTGCRNYRVISLVAHAGKILLTILLVIIAINRRFGAYCKAKELLPGEQCELRPHRSTKDTFKGIGAGT